MSLVVTVAISVEDEDSVYIDVSHRESLIPDSQEFADHIDACRILVAQKTAAVIDIVDGQLEAVKQAGKQEDPDDSAT